MTGVEMTAMAQCTAGGFQLSVLGPGPDAAADLGLVENIGLGGAAASRLAARGYAAARAWERTRRGEFVAPVARIEGYRCPAWCEAVHLDLEGIVPVSGRHLVTHFQRIGAIPALLDAVGDFTDLDLSITRTDSTDLQRCWPGDVVLSLGVGASSANLLPAVLPGLQLVLSRAVEYLASIERGGA